MNDLRTLRPVKTEETVSHRQTNVKEVGTPPARSNLSTSLTAVSTAVPDKVTRTVSRKATVEEQLSNKAIHPEQSYKDSVQKKSNC